MTAGIRPRQDLTIANLAKMISYAQQQAIRTEVKAETVKGKDCIILYPVNATCEEWIDTVCKDLTAWWRPAHFKVIE